MELDVVHKILKALGHGSRKLFRNNVGTGWAGRVIKGPRTVTLGPDDVAVLNARPLKAGLCTGSADIIGWQTVTITAEMVGRQVAVFAAIEVKTDRGRASAEQRNFIDAVIRAGGLAGVARGVESADDICCWRPINTDRRAVG